MSEKNFGLRIYGNEISVDLFIFEKIPGEKELIKSLQSQNLKFPKKFAVLIQKEGERIHPYSADGSNNPFKAFIFKEKDTIISSRGKVKSHFFVDKDRIKFDFTLYKVEIVKIRNKRKI